jgi:hypothetical protein
MVPLALDRSNAHTVFDAPGNIREEGHSDVSRWLKPLLPRHGFVDRLVLTASQLSQFGYDSRSMITGEERLAFLALPAHVRPTPLDPSAVIVKMLTALHLLEVVASGNMLSTSRLIPNVA